jgi:hypothetical protein
MAYTLATLTTSVRQLLNEAVASFWTDTEIQEWIKQACIDISTKTLCVKHRDYFPLATNAQVYTASSFQTNKTDVIAKVQYIWYNDGMSAVALKRTTPELFGGFQYGTDTGPPKEYYEDNQEIFVWPIPSANENTDKVHLIYSYVTDDITKIQWNYQPMAILYACAMAKAKDEHFQQASMYQQLYLNAINFERQDKFDKGIEPTQLKKVP